MVKTGEDARLELLEGVRFGADAVARTLGPYGRNWVTGVRGGTPHITNDGVSILRELWHPEEVKMLGLRTMRESALKLNELCGDGTTSAAVLTYAILLEGTKRLGFEVVDPATGKLHRSSIIGAPSAMDVKRQIDKEAAEVIEKLKAMAVQIESKEQLVNAVRVSVEDEKLAEMIGDMQWQIGPEGTILVEDSNDPDVSIERINGIRFDNGFPTSAMINNLEKQLLELSDVHVILTNRTIHSITDFSSNADKSGAGIINTLIANLAANGKPREIVIVASKFEQLAMHEISENLNKHQIKLAPINAPYFNRGEIFKDLAALLGGTFIDEEQNRSLRDMTMADVGFATKVQASRWTAIFAGTPNDAAKNRITERVKKLEKEMKGEQSVFAQNDLRRRIAQLQNGLGLMKVGALSETDQKRMHDKIDDAVASARSAYQEGVVRGAGIALRDIAAEMPDTAILKKPLQCIYVKVMENAGSEFGVEDWVMDPVKVVRLVVEKAASIAGNLVTAEGAIDHENPKPRYFLDEQKITSDNDE